MTQENIIPIYIRGSEQDPRIKVDPNNVNDNIPNRPQGRRIDAETQNIGTGQNTFGGMTITTSYGFFPSLFGLQFQNFTTATTNTANNNRNNPEDELQQLYLSATLYFLTSAVILCLLFF